MEREAEGDPGMSTRPVRSYERRLAMAFGGVTLSAMLVFVFVTFILNANTQANEEKRLSASLAGTLSEAIGRVSFSGKHQTRLLVEEIREKIPALSYIAVDDPEGNIVAHSDASFDDTKEDSETSAIAKQSIAGGKAVFREYTAANGRRIREVVVPYRGGLYSEVLGVVRAGMDVADIRRDRLILTFVLFTIGLLLTGGAIGAVFHMGNKFGGEMRSLAEKLDGIVENSPVAMSIFEPNGSVQRLNRKFTELFGYTIEEIPTVDEWFPVAYPDSAYREKIRKEWFDEVDSYMRTGRPFSPIEAAVRCRDGSEKIIIFYFESIGDIAITTFIDVTERKKAEESRIAMERQMLHVQKLESLGVLAGGMAHDFNNILMAMMGHAELARLRLPKDSPAIRSLDEIVNASRRASDLSRQMLAYSGRGKFLIEPVDISHLISDIAQLLSSSISKQAKLILDLRHDLPAVEGDATQLRQVVMNLITNASEAIGNSAGKIEVETGTAHFTRKELDQAILGTAIPEGEYLFLRVRDSGCGMDRETLNRIFEPFFTTKFTGRGLGMAAVMGIVKGHRGAIRIVSEPGKGSEFTILLPPSSATALKTAAQPGGWTGEGTILLVDDEESIRSVSVQMLAMLGFKTLTAADGHEAVRIYAECRAPIDLVILDLTMPGMDGVETLRRLREIDPDVRAVISSGYTEEEIGSRFANNRIEGFIQKPYDQTQLALVLRSVLNDSGNAAT